MRPLLPSQRNTKGNAAAPYCLLVFGYTCVNIPYGTLCGALTQNIEERAQINTSRSVCAMVAINIINIITLPLIAAFGGEDQARGYLLVTVLYGGRRPCRRS